MKSTELPPALRKALEGASIRGLWNIANGIESSDERPLPQRAVAEIAVAAWGLKSADDARFLGLLQQIHDNERPEYWAKELTGFAVSFGLIDTPLEYLQESAWLRQQAAEEAAEVSQ